MLPNAVAHLKVLVKHGFEVKRYGLQRVSS